MTIQKGGFDQARVFTDENFLKLLQKHGLPENASLAQVEEKATSLLDSPLTVIEDASLVLGRTINAREKDVLGPIFVGGRTGKDRFGVALLTVSIDDMIIRK